MAKSNEVEMTLQAHSATFLDDNGLTLEEILSQIENAALSNRQRTCSELSNGAQALISGFMRHPQNDGIGCSVSFFEPEALHSTISTDADRHEAQFGAATAGAGHEFLSQNVSVFVKGNRAITCGLGKRANHICFAVCGVAREAGIIHSTQLFGLNALPHIETLDLIQTHGVKSIKFNATPLVRDLGGRLSDPILDEIFNVEDTAESIRKKAESTVRLEIKSSFFSRNSKLSMVEHEGNNLAENVSRSILESSDISDFTIVLGNNQSIKNGRLATTKKVKLARDNTTHSHFEAHRAMTEFMGEIS